MEKPDLLPFGARLFEAVGPLQAFAKRSGFAERTLRNWVNGRSSPGVDDLQRIAKLTRRPLAWFLGEDVAPTPQVDPAPNVVRIAVVDARASAGPGAWNEHSQEIDGVAFPLDWLRKLGGPGVNPERCDFMRVAGDSMFPTIATEALILVNRGDTSPPLARAKKRLPDDDIFVFIWQGDIKVKRLTRQPGEQMLLISDNARLFPPELVPAHAPLTVFGRVIWWDNRL